MSQRFNSNRPPLSAADGVLIGHALSAAAEASVRQLIIAGNDKIALKRAKEIHKALGTAVSEALLVDAYAARIRSLIRQNLTLEAEGLLDLVRRRYASAKTRLDELSTRALARAGSLNDAVAPLGDPALSAERHSAIERAIQQEVWDLAALATCDALSVDDPLRQAASALDRAFVAVTSGPVDEDALALPEVSHRSPLAPWKLLVRAIACFYRADDSSCQQYLDAIGPESAAARLAAVVHAALRREATAPLAAAARALVSQITGDPATLRRALEALDQAFASDRKDRILKAIRMAVHECRQCLPGHLERLQQHISVRCAIAGMDKDQVTGALGGPSRHDAYFLRLFARAMEETTDVQNVAEACRLWAQFRQQAAQEGWFAANGVEAATLYLHMADLLRRIPNGLLWQLRPSPRSRNMSDDDVYFLFPEKLYQRACALDPHAEGFSQWMEWAARQSAAQAERVADAWHKIRPQDLEPVLCLMEAAEHRRAFPTALGYLTKAERIDGVHPAVRGARLRLLTGRIVRQIQQKKFGVAEQDLVQMATLPQAQHGDWPAFLAALSCGLSAVRGDRGAAEASRAETERLLESRVAAAILVSSVATASKQRIADKLDSVEKLAGADRAALPAAVARVMALAADVQFKLDISWSWMVETAKQFPASSQALNSGQLFGLAEAALGAKHVELAYAVSAAGLARGGGTEARFLLLRARSLPERQFERRAVCAAAAAELARRQPDTGLVREAVELARYPSESGTLSLTFEQAGEVLRKEKAEPAVLAEGRRGPDYRDVVDRPCQCVECRRARGELAEPFDNVDADDAIFDELGIPPDMPPEIARVLFEETRNAVRNGESLEQLLSRLVGPGLRRRKRKKGRRR